MGKFSLANLFGVTIRESANDGSDFTNPDADYRRLFLGEDGQLHVKDSAGTVTDIGTVTAAAGTLLGLTGYRKGSDGAVGTTTSGTSADVDATNLSCAFTAPASGNVLVRLTASAGSSTLVSDNYWQVRESTTVLADTLVWFAATSQRIYSVTYRIAGIAAGAHTYKWGHRTDAGTLTLYSGPSYGEATIEVWSAP